MSLKIQIFMSALAICVGNAAKCGLQAIEPIGALRTGLFDSIGGKLTGRIVGGVEAIPHSFPWQVAMLNNAGSQFCGGSIISDRYILSAAHCCRTYGSVASRIKIRVGAHNKVLEESHAKTVSVKAVHEHPEFWYTGGVNDVCLLELSDALVFNNHVLPVCLGDVVDGLVGQRCIATGWGSTQQRDHGVPVPPAPRPSDLLQQTGLVVLDQEVCKKIYGKEFFNGITPDMVCAHEERASTCQGDSGGPLVCQSAPEAPFKLVGVSSWLGGCADSIKKYPSVFSRVSVAREWILSVIGI